jgi:transposase-like protein
MTTETPEIKPIKNCPYCKGTDVIKSGLRKKKLETVQVYYCRHCDKKFTPLITKSKTYPVALILKSLINYNRFLSSGEILDQLKKQYGHDVSIASVLGWIKEYDHYLPFLRMREFLAKKLNSGQEKLSDLVHEQRLFHNQIYDFKYHRAKMNVLMDEDYKNYKLRAAQSFLELVIGECPHQIFKESQKRSSEFKDIFNLDEVRITRKSNRACDMARFVMQAVANNKMRHERLQEFMLFCDSTTIATEIPVLLDKEDIGHYKNMLNFKIPIDLADEEVITGHIDILQLRNGMIHILDFKPSACKVKPIDQLTIYALALSRLTSLRLYNFKCAWFDEDDYYEFYPLHVVYKKKKKSRTRRN